MKIEKYLLLCAVLLSARAAEPDPTLFFSPPPEFANQFGAYSSQLKFYDGHPVKDAADWQNRRAEILAKWHGLMGPWPALLAKPRLELVSHDHRDNFTQHKIKIEITKNVLSDGYLLIPDGNGPFPAVFVPYYEPETSIGTHPDKQKSAFRDFAYQLAKRNFVTLAIGTPGGDARKPDNFGAECQPLSFLAYVAANCHTALAQRPEVDPARIGIVGHSYGGKWAMFGSCLYEKYACAVWSDPGIVFDGTRANVNYWEPWYLGFDPDHTRKTGTLPSAENPACGPYKIMRETGRDLHELHALMAPRPFLVSGGSEDYPARWPALNRSIEVNAFLGQKNRVAMTNRKDHSPNEESNAAIYAFFEHFLRK
ncbi:MAG TPA: sialidase [Planctomycetota bacterium]|nr:sialidase [Planctomycetota bacterium]